MNGWDDLVTTALLGTGRRAPDPAALPGSVAAGLRADADPAVGVLAAAALATSFRRAGQRPHTIGTASEPAPRDDAPTVGAAATSRLSSLLAAGDMEILAEWLRAVARAGLRAPAESLPALLDLAARDPGIASAVLAASGSRGEWLAGLRPEWSTVVTATSPASGSAGLDAPDNARGTDGTDSARGGGPAPWTHGDTVARRTYFTELRRRDPAAAVALLAESWKRETGEDRRAFVGMLADNLGDADEPLLEAVLDDRRRDVRETAALLLSRLPRSAFAARMVARARECVRMEGRRGRRRIAVTPPAECDGAMERDGIRAGRETKRLGEKAWWLGQLVVATPLPAWNDLLGADPATLVESLVDEDWGRLMRDSWTAAAVRQRDAGWALALLPRIATSHADLLDVLPDAQRATAVTTLLRRRDLFAVAQQTVMPTTALLAGCPPPWPAPLADAVLALLAAPRNDPTAYGVRDHLRLLGRRLPPDRSTAVGRLAAAHPADSLWRNALDELADTLTLRHDMLEEIR